jgi:hypothetical protein
MVGIPSVSDDSFLASLGIGVEDDVKTDRHGRPFKVRTPEPEPAEEDPDLADYGDDFLGGDVEPEPEPEPAPKVTRQVKAPAPAPAPKSGMSARDRAKMLTKNAFDPTDISPDAIDFDEY